MGAVILHRLVFPQERAALFGMALIAGFVHGRFFEHTGPFSTMGIMAVGTGNLAFSDGMTGKFGAIELLGFVAAVANRLLLPLDQYRIALGVDVVATTAGHVCCGMLVPKGLGRLSLWKLPSAAQISRCVRAPLRLMSSSARFSKSCVASAATA